jgi:hypothetical protein
MELQTYQLSHEKYVVTMRKESAWTRSTFLHLSGDGYGWIPTTTVLVPFEACIQTPSINPDLQVAHKGLYDMTGVMPRVRHCGLFLERTDERKERKS